ncbi:MAG: hypothetical protein M3541_14200, partial [Acidobacteriota bacterium]|nr:hypothetical protein [Acidobacteriota bacterium]
MGPSVANSLRMRVVAFVLLLSGLLLPGGCARELPADVARAAPPTVSVLQPAPGQLALPKKAGSIRLAIIGDSGRGDEAQNAVAQQMVVWRQQFPFDLVLMLGDNIYDSHTGADYRAKFE